MSKEKILYVYMNKNFEFIDEEGNITDDIFEAAGYTDLDRAIKERKDFKYILHIHMHHMKEVATKIKIE